MPVQSIKIVYCDCCGKLMKVGKFGDALTLKDVWKMEKLNKKHVCLKCKLLKKDR